MSNEQVLSQFADGDPCLAGMPHDREQGLMLLGRQAHGFRGLLAEIQEPPQAQAELRQSFVIGFFHRATCPATSTSPCPTRSGPILHNPASLSGFLRLPSSALNLYRITI